mgnify:FL=1
MNKIKALAIFFLILSISLSQNDVEEMMRKLEEATRKEMEKTQKKVEQYISAQDSAFAAFLEQDWELYNTYDGINNLEEPKLKKPPVAKPTQEIDLPDKKIRDIPIPKKEKVEDKKTEPEKIKPETESTEPKPQQSEPQDLFPEPEFPASESMKPEPEKPDKKSIEPGKKTAPEYEEKMKSVRLNFYGAPVEIDYHAELATNLKSPFDNKDISRSWKKLAAADYQNFIEKLQNYKDKLNINGWGYYKLINRVGLEINQGSRNNASIFTWFFLTKSGYDVRVAYNEKNLYILMPSESMLYSVSYLTIDGEKYFLLNRQNRKDKIYSYKNDYPNANKKLELKMTTEPVLTQQGESKVLDFNYGGERQKIEVAYNPAIIEYLNDYPQTEYEIYFSAPLSSGSKRQLLQELAPLLEGKNETEAVNFLLRFVQKSFDYQTDEMHFGREKPLFPEETLFYPFSDCEDRSVLFSYLLRNLLGLEVIGLKYPGHIATAIRIEGPARGDYFTYHGSNYLICDPTYINANIGQCMPKYKNIQPEVVFR